MTAPRHGVVLLAAGGSRRLGTPKQLLRVDGETLIHRAARLALLTKPGDALVVLGHAGDELGAAVDDLPLRRVDSADWQRGMGASLVLGLAALMADCEAALVLLCDQPALTVDHLNRLIAAWREDPRRAAASAYAGVLGVPAILPRAWFGGVDPETDRGARDLLRDRAAEVTAVPCAALAQDVDRPGDLAALG